ncbi:MAG TPA: Rne/Rng family ribonuclease [Blastocatellia bacterium]|nr:Rne/Rng family ribonuclease [Blastocatellia bacterium]
MAKELIISANVHEKKVAMLEDGVVTEFYVERRDENQGVVGNLYKGRVMKVLPGMQSAFVDIGLERDAFLYVSDFTEFMEEAEEIDFREVSDEQRTGHRTDDRSRRGDRPRPEPISAFNRPTPAAEPPRLEEPSAERPVRIEDAVELLAEIADESLIPPPPPEEELPEHDAGLAAEPPIETVSVERITDDEPIDLVSAPEEESTAVTAEAAEAVEAEEKPKRGRGRKSAEPKKKAAKSEDKPVKGTRRTSKTGAKRSSRRGADDEATSEESATSFQRVTDEDVRPDAGDLLKDAIVQEKIIEQVHNAEFQTGLFQPEPEPEWRVGSLRSISDVESSFQRVVDENAEASSQKIESVSNLETAPLEIPSEPSEPKSSPFRHLSDVVRGLYGRIQSNASADETAASDAGSDDAIHEVYSADPFVTVDAPLSDEAKTTAESSADEDREAEVRDRGSRGEFAVRRGGRGRRGRGGRREQPAPAHPSAPTEEDSGITATAQDDAIQSHDDTPKEESIHSEAAETVDAKLTESRPSESRSEDPRGGAHRSQGSRHQQRRPDSRRPDHRRPDLRGLEQRRQDLAPSRRPERGGAPTISELLHEGQEILVQIAKEPIAKKGARITSHIALPGRFIVYMPTVNHIGVSRKIPNEVERVRLKRIVTGLRDREGATGGFIARTACAGHSEQELSDDMRYLLRTWADIRKKGERVKAPALAHRDLDLVQRILRDQMSEEFTAIRIDNEVEYARIVEFVNRVQPKLVKRVKLYTGDQPILEKYGVQAEIDKAVRPRVWLKSGGYIVINQTEALVAIDVNTGKFVGKSDKLEDTITRTNLEAAKEIVRQIRLRDLGGIIVLDLIDMEERKNRQKVMMALQQELSHDRSPSKILSINDFGLVAITRKRVKQSLERTLCTPCPYCQGAGMVKSAQTMCFEILEQAKAASKQLAGASDVMLRVSPHVAESLRTTEREVMEEIEAHFGTPVTIEPDPNLHQEQFDFAVM